MAKSKKQTIVEEVVEIPETETEIEETIVEEVVKPSDEELFLGAEPEIKKVKIVDYTSLKRRYKVQNLINPKTYELHGRAIGAILGTDEEAKKQLKEGAKRVELFKRNGKEVIKTHIIEVIK